MKNVLVSALTAAVVGACFYAIGPLLAARNSSGTMAAVNGPYIAGTTIDQAQVNARLADIENEITDSKSRSGKGDFSAAVRGVDGTVSSPAYSFTSETGTGWYRAGANDVRFALSGTAKGYWNTVGLGLGLAPVYPLDVSLAVGSDNARFGDKLAILGSAPLIGFNIHNDGSYKYMTTNSGFIWSYDTSANAMIAYTAPSGTAGNVATLTEQMRVGSGGLTIGAGGLTIGSGGTAISKSLRGTTVWNPGTVASNTAATAGMTITGAVAGADCVAGVVDPSPLTGYPVQCITTTNNCNIAIRNQQNTGFTFGSATFYCRVFNP